MKPLLTIAAIWTLGIFSLHADQNLAVEFAKGQKRTWTSKEHPKAKGIKMKICYPSGWQAKEGTRPNIRQEFVGKSASGMDVVALTTRSLPAPFDRELTDDEKKEVLARDAP